MHDAVDFVAAYSEYSMWDIETWKNNDINASLKIAQNIDNNITKLNIRYLHNQSMTSNDNFTNVAVAVERNSQSWTWPTGPVAG